VLLKQRYTTHHLFLPKIQLLTAFMEDPYSLVIQKKVQMELFVRRIVKLSLAAMLSRIKEFIVILKVSLTISVHSNTTFPMIRKMIYAMDK
jgi:hypothetical protein